MMESEKFFNDTSVAGFKMGNYSLGNQSSSSGVHSLIEQFSCNRRIDEPYYSVLIALYSFLILFGATGNIMVVLAVLRNKQMQTAR